MPTQPPGDFMSSTLRGVAGTWDSATTVLISTMRFGPIRPATGVLTAMPGHRPDGTIPEAPMTPVDGVIPEADMILGVREIRAVGMIPEDRPIRAAHMIRGEDQNLETQCILRNAPITSMLTSKGTSTGTQIKAGSKRRRTAGQRRPARHRNLIVTKSPESKATQRRNRGARARNAVAVAEDGPDAERFGSGSLEPRK
jgi:hypothetical protein